MGGAEWPSHAAPSTALGKRAAVVGALSVISTISLSAAFLLSAFNSRWTMECCFLQNCSEWLCSIGRRWRARSAAAPRQASPRW